MQPLKSAGKDVRPHNDWVISENEKMLLSVYKIDSWKQLSLNRW